MNSVSLRRKPGKTVNPKPTKNPSKKPATKSRKVSENEIHIHAWAWVKKEIPGLLIFHVANERKAAVQFHVKLKRMGVVGGVADFLVFPENGRKVAIELKDDKGVQDDEQIKFQKQWERAGGEYHLIRTLEKFKSVVTAATLFG